MVPVTELVSVSSSLGKEIYDEVTSIIGKGCYTSRSEFYNKALRYCITILERITDEVIGNQKLDREGWNMAAKEVRSRFLQVCPGYSMYPKGTGRIFQFRVPAGLFRRLDEVHIDAGTPELVRICITVYVFRIREGRE